MIKLISIERALTPDKVVALLASEDTPESFNITGADVDGLQDDDVVARGSLLITTKTKYFAFDDGTFTELEW